MTVQNVESKQKQHWWSSLEDECPITLEPLSSLPYPPFVLTDDRAVSTQSAGGSGKSCNDHHFDGLALATYIVSRGTFASPLTREPLNYDDCVRLDEYLDEHVYRGEQDHARDENFSAALGRRDDKICVKEAWLLRDSIKVKVGGGSDGDEGQRRRAEALRNEAAAALRGLFVFGHRSENNHRGEGDDWTSLGRTPQSRSLPRAPGGFDLHHCLDSNSINQQEGLRIVDDDEAALEAADVAAWRDVQKAFPTLPHSNGDGSPSIKNSKNDDYDQNQLLERVRQTAKITIEEERQETETQERNRQRYFMQALQRKKERINARRKAKEEAAKALTRKKEAEDVLQSARDEIDRWRAEQWDKWERTDLIRKSKTDAEGTSSNENTPPETNEPEHGMQQSALQNKELTAEERAARDAAKKKVKRRKAKERAKEKRRSEKLEEEKRKRALALREEKDRSAAKCGSCGEGILGCGFEKYGAIFCSPKCARKGPSTKD